MSEYDDTNKGVLFKNDKKETDKHPDYTGKMNVGGKDMRLAAWIRESKKGTKFMSLSLSEFREQKPEASKEPEFEDDDLPF